MAAQSKLDGTRSASIFQYVHSLAHLEDPPFTPNIYPKLDIERKETSTAAKGSSPLTIHLLKVVY